MKNHNDNNRYFQKMSIALVVDAACDLPQSFLEERGIELFPISINVDGNIYTDDKDPQKLKEFYSQNLLTLEHEAESIPYSPEQMAHLFTESIVPNYDFALIQTVSKKRSQIHENSLAAQPMILTKYRENKQKGDADGHFGMRVMNSSTLFTGQGILAAFTSDLIKAGKSKQDIVRLAEAFKAKIYAYAIPPDVSYIRERARKRGETSLGMLGALVAKSLDIKPIIQAKGDETKPIAKIRGFDEAVNRLFTYGKERIEKGLLCPYVVVSIAGDESALRQYESFQLLEASAKAHSVKLLTCAMGLTSGLNVGPGAISLGLASEEHDF
jgi:DegV family protein with EDD domain